MVGKYGHYEHFASCYCNIVSPLEYIFRCLTRLRGDIFLAFSTGNHLANDTQKPFALQMLPNNQLDGFFLGVAEAVEEAILNALTAAETMTGFRGRTAYELPLDALQI